MPLNVLKYRFFQMMKKNNPNRKNRRKNKNKEKSKTKPKINNNDMYDISTYFAEQLVSNLADETKQKFADAIQKIIDRNKEKENK